MIISSEWLLCGSSKHLTFVIYEYTDVQSTAFMFGHTKNLTGQSNEEIPGRFAVCRLVLVQLRYLPKHLKGLTQAVCLHFGCPTLHQLEILTKWLDSTMLVISCFGYTWNRRNENLDEWNLVDETCGAILTIWFNQVVRQIDCNAFQAVYRWIQHQYKLLTLRVQFQMQFALRSNFNMDLFLGWGSS